MNKYQKARDEMANESINAFKSAPFEPTGMWGREIVFFNSGFHDGFNLAVEMLNVRVKDGVCLIEHG